MKQHWTKIELTDSWSLSQGEICYLEKKDNKLVYAIKMRYFDLQGYLPDRMEDIPLVAVDYVASRLSIKPNKAKDYAWQSRIAQIHNTEIREYYGFKKLEQADLSSIKDFIEADLLTQGLSISQINDEVYKLLKKSKIEPSANNELSRYISNIYSQYETQFFTECKQYLPLTSEQAVNKLLGMYDNDQTILNFIRIPVGKVSTTTITEEQEKLSYIDNTGVLYTQFFNNVPRKLLKKYHDRVATSTPYRLVEIKDSDQNKFYGLLACFCKYKGTRIIDNFIEILVKKLKKLEQFGKVKIKEELWEHYTRENKNDLLDNLVDISLAHPDGIIKEKIYPEVGGREKLEQSKLSRQSFKQARRESEYTHLRSLYVHGYRKDIFLILNNLRLSANSNNLVLEAINFIIKHQNNDAYKAEYYPLDCGVITKGIVSPLDLKIMQSQEGKIKRLYYEIAILGLLKKELRCKNIWAESAFKYRDPEKDLPVFSKKIKSLHCKMLNISENPHKEVLALKHNMLKALKEFNSGIANDPEVRIGIKAKKPHIYLTPYIAQPTPINIESLKDEISFLWPNTSLLDILKEADLRVGLTSELIEIGGKTILDDKLLQQRLLLSLFAIATNTEFNKVRAGIPNISESDLRYVRKRFINPESLKHIIRKLVNATIAIRDKQIWGEIINSFASDSTKFAAWSENLMTEYHIRYQGYGIMAYWHVDKKALCISSQIIKCGASEIAAMLAGIIHHATNAKVENHSTDTHGQSLVAFAFAYLLGIDLRPRIKGIGRIKLYKADDNIAKSSYSNLEEVMTRPINWQLIIENYDQIIRYVAALKLGTAEPEALLKRFISDNIQSPLYKAILELGRAVRTIYVCRYLSSKELRIEVEEALNVIENWNSGNNFVFFGKRGVISSNDEIDQELSILCLHLLQSSLVYINTLMQQQVLKTPGWQQRLTLEDKRGLTPLFYKHINQYGLHKLDMNERIKIEGTHG
jgi:TnpA family transposase